MLIRVKLHGQLPVRLLNRFIRIVLGTTEIFVAPVRTVWLRSLNTNSLSPFAPRAARGRFTALFGT